MESRKTVKLFLGLMVITLLLSSLTGCGAKKTEGKKDAVESVAVTVVKAEKGDLQKFTDLSGKIEGQSEINVIPKLGGKVESIAVEVGDRVKKGDVLVRLETREIRAQLKQARAGLAAAKAGFANARSNLERMEALFKQGAISRQQLDSARLQYETAKSSGLDQAEAAVQLAQTQLDNAIIESPIDGIVAFRYVDPGEMAGPTSPVITVVNMDTVTVTVNVPETEINSVQLGDKVSVTVPAAGQKDIFTGEVTMVGPAADPRTKAYPVEISIDNEGHILKPGMFAQVSLGTMSVKDVIVIPQEALVDMDGKKVVYVARDGKAEERDVTVGITTGKEAAILDGLNTGDPVVVEGQHRLEDGVPVAVQGGDK